jgi:hypothetical protein
MTDPIEASPAALRRAAAELSGTGTALRGDLTRTYHGVAPPAGAHDGWGVTHALQALVVAADCCLARGAADLHGTADRLSTAAAGYEAADARAARPGPATRRAAPR